MDVLRNIFQNTSAEEELKSLNRTLFNLIRGDQFEDFLDVSPLVVRIIKGFTNKDIELLLSGRISLGNINNEGIVESSQPRSIGPGTKYKYELLMLAKQLSANPGIFTCVFEKGDTKTAVQIKTLTYKEIGQLSSGGKGLIKLRKGNSIVRWRDLSVAIKKPGITNQELMLCLQ
jgi:hypothetical protein